MIAEQCSIDFSAPPAPATDLPPEVLQIIGHLHMYCRDPDRAQSAAQIAQHLNLGRPDGRDVRNFISLYQDRFPFVVCSLSGQGFFVSDDPEQLSHYHRYLYSTLRALAVRIGTFRRNCQRCGYVPAGAGPRAQYMRKRGST